MHFVKVWVAMVNGHWDYIKQTCLDATIEHFADDRFDAGEIIVDRNYNFSVLLASLECGCMR